MAVFHEIAKKINVAAEPKTNAGANVNANASAAVSTNAFDPDTYDYNYITIHNSIFEDQGDVESNASYLTKLAMQRNEEDTTGIHGMSEEEYDEYQAHLKNAYGIEIEDLSVGKFQSVAVSMERQIGKSYNPYEEMAASYDSVLDLVLDEKLSNAMKELFPNQDMPSWGALLNKSSVLKEKYGIVIEQTSDRMYYLSLVDENGKIIQDEMGNLAQVKKYDGMIPDGLAQVNEVFASGALDMMGYDCISMLDFSKKEYEAIKEMAYLDNLSLGTSSDIKGTDIKSIREIMTSKMVIKDDSDWIENHRKAYRADFDNKLAAGYYNNRVNTVTGEVIEYQGHGGGSKSSAGNATLESLASSTDGYYKNNKTSNEEKSEKLNNKNKVSKLYFDELVSQLVEEGCSQTQATKKISKKYYYEGLSA